jgi:hypothetical protein
MYKVLVNVSGKRARLVPSNRPLNVSERDLGEVSQEDALGNRDNLSNAIRGLLEDNGITDAGIYSIELPDNLAPRQELENVEAEEESTTKKTSKAKGPVTKPENPKEGEQNSQTNKPEVKPSDQSAGNQPSETERQAPVVDETKKD